MSTPTLSLSVLQSLISLENSSQSLWFLSSHSFFSCFVLNPLLVELSFHVGGVGLYAEEAHHALDSVSADEADVDVFSHLPVVTYVFAGRNCLDVSTRSVQLLKLFLTDSLSLLEQGTLRI